MSDGHSEDELAVLRERLASAERRVLRGDNPEKTVVLNGEANLHYLTGVGPRVQSCFDAGRVNQAGNPPHEMALPVTVLSGELLPIQRQAALLKDATGRWVTPGRPTPGPDLSCWPCVMPDDALGPLHVYSKTRHVIGYGCTDQGNPGTCQLCAEVEYYSVMHYDAGQPPPALLYGRIAKPGYWYSDCISYQEWTNYYTNPSACARKPDWPIRFVLACVYVPEGYRYQLVLLLHMYMPDASGAARCAAFASGIPYQGRIYGLPVWSVSDCTPATFLLSEPGYTTGAVLPPNGPSRVAVYR